MMDALKRTLKRGLARAGYRIQRLHNGHTNPLHLSEEDPMFGALYGQIQALTLVDRERCFMLYQLAGRAGRLDGAAAEVGVYRGGTALLLAKTLRPAGKMLHLFDTFAGMPRTDAARDTHREGDFADTSLEAVRGLLSDCPNVAFHAGLFPATAQALADERFCFVHVDVDIYESVRACCAFFYPRLAAGGVLIFDDYGFVSTPGAKLAVDEFCAAQCEAPIYLPTGQCVVMRLAANDPSGQSPTPKAP